MHLSFHLNFVLLFVFYFKNGYGEYIEVKPHLVYNERSDRYKVKHAKEKVKYNSDDQDDYQEYGGDQDFRRIFDLTPFDDPPISEKDVKDYPEVDLDKVDPEPADNNNPDGLLKEEVDIAPKARRNNYRNYDRQERMEDDEDEDEDYLDSERKVKEGRRDGKVESDPAEGNPILKEIPNNTPESLNDKNRMRRQNNDDNNNKKDNEFNNDNDNKKENDNFQDEVAEERNLKHLIRLNRRMIQNVLQEMQNNNYRRSDKGSILAQLKNMINAVNLIDQKINH